MKPVSMLIILCLLHCTDSPCGGSHSGVFAQATVEVSLKVLLFSCVQFKYKGKPFKIILTVYPYQATPYSSVLPADWARNSARALIGQFP